MKTPSDSARSIRFAGLVILIATASLLQACSSDAIPTGPSSAAPSSATPPSAPEVARVRVSGTVTGDYSAPVEGVKVTVCSWTAAGQPCSKDVTNSAGFYSVSIVETAGVTARVEKEGYESAWHMLSMFPAAEYRFDLRIIRIKP